MTDRWTIGLTITAVLCCATPALVGLGLAGAAWGAVRAHWGWALVGLGLVALAIAPRRLHHQDR